MAFPDSPSHKIVYYVVFWVWARASQRWGAGVSALGRGRLSAGASVIDC